jgi:hypothetical protein
MHPYETAKRHNCYTVSDCFTRPSRLCEPTCHCERSEAISVLYKYLNINGLLHFVRNDWIVGEAIWGGLAGDNEAISIHLEGGFSESVRQCKINRCHLSAGDSKVLIIQ